LLSRIAGSLESAGRLKRIAGSLKEASGIEDA
jgi:hypothetical protein